jgi:hypothetical protein
LYSGVSKADKQKRAQTDTFSAQKQCNKIGRSYQNDHKKSKKRQIAYKFTVVLVISHVLNRVKMDQ